MVELDVRSSHAPLGEEEIPQNGLQHVTECYSMYVSGTCGQPLGWIAPVGVWSIVCTVCEPIKRGTDNAHVVVLNERAAKRMVMWLGAKSQVATSLPGFVSPVPDRRERTVVVKLSLKEKLVPTALLCEDKPNNPLGEQPGVHGDLVAFCPRYGTRQLTLQYSISTASVTATGSTVG